MKIKPPTLPFIKIKHTRSENFGKRGEVERDVWCASIFLSIFKGVVGFQAGAHHSITQFVKSGSQSRPQVALLPFWRLNHTHSSQPPGVGRPRPAFLEAQCCHSLGPDSPAGLRLGLSPLCLGKQSQPAALSLE